MMQLFYTRVKSYVEALKSNDALDQINKVFETGLLAEGHKGFSKSLSAYAIEFSRNLDTLTLGQIALADIKIPEAPK